MELGPYITYFFILNKSLTLKYCGNKFYCWSKLEYPEKTTELLQVPDKLHIIMLYLVQLSMLRIKLITSVMKGSDEDVKSNFHMIIAVMSSPEKFKQMHKYFITNRIFTFTATSIDLPFSIRSLALPSHTIPNDP